MTNCGRSEDEVNLFTQSGGRKKQKTAKQSRKKSLRKTIKKLSKKKALKKIKNIIEKRVREIIRDNISKQKGGGTEGSNVLESILNAISKFFQDIWEYITKLFTGREEPKNNNQQVGKSIKSTANKSKLTNKELKTFIEEVESLGLVPYQEELDTKTKERTPNKRPSNKRPSNKAESNLKKYKNGHYENRIAAENRLKLKESSGIRNNNFSKKFKENNKSIKKKIKTKKAKKSSGN